MKFKSMIAGLLAGVLMMGNEVEGSAYWSYRVTDQENDAWDFCKCVKNGWLSYR